MGPLKWKDSKRTNIAISEQGNVAWHLVRTFWREVDLRWQRSQGEVSCRGREKHYRHCGS